MEAESEIGVPELDLPTFQGLKSSCVVMHLWVHGHLTPRYIFNYFPCSLMQATLCTARTFRAVTFWLMMRE